MKQKLPIVLCGDGVTVGNLLNNGGSTAGGGNKFNVVELNGLPIARGLKEGVEVCFTINHHTRQSAAVAVRPRQIVVLIGIKIPEQRLPREKQSGEPVGGVSKKGIHTV